MYLVDTSVWIDYFRNKHNSAVQQFINILDKKLAFGITSLIYQELLQGAATSHDVEQLIRYLDTQRFFHPMNNIISYQSAARIYFDCRQRGITIRSTIDCLIAQIAIEHDLILLHNDNDFIRINKIYPALKIFNF